MGSGPSERGTDRPERQQAAESRGRRRATARPASAADGAKRTPTRAGHRADRAQEKYLPRRKPKINNFLVPGPRGARPGHRKGKASGTPRHPGRRKRCPGRRKRHLGDGPHARCQHMRRERNCAPFRGFPEIRGLIAMQSTERSVAARSRSALACAATGVCFSSAEMPWRRQNRGRSRLSAPPPRSRVPLGMWWFASLFNDLGSSPLFL